MKNARSVYKLKIKSYPEKKESFYMKRNIPLDKINKYICIGKSLSKITIQKKMNLLN
jgi:hypothetical protein